MIGNVVYVGRGKVADARPCPSSRAVFDLHKAKELKSSEGENE